MSRRQVQLSPDDRLDAARLGCQIEINDAKHRSVVSDCARPHVVFLAPLEEFRNLDGPIENTVFGMKVQVAKTSIH